MERTATLHRIHVEDDVKMALDYCIQRYKQIGLEMKYLLNNTPSAESKQYIRENWDYVA